MVETNEDPISQFSNGDSTAVDQARQRTVSVGFGQSVTVQGRACSRSQDVVWDRDDCPDMGQSVGLAGEFMVGPDRWFGLSVGVGSRGALGRWRLALGALEACLALVACLALASLGLTGAL